MNSLPNEMHPDIKNLYEYWCSIAPTSRLPGRQHFDPLDVPVLLPRLLLIDVHREPLRFQHRLVGSKIEEFAGENLTGRRYADRLAGSNLRRVENYLKRVVELKQPSWRRGKPLIRWEKEYVELERLYLPLARDGKTVDMILAISVHSRQPMGEKPLANARADRIPSAVLGRSRKFVRRHLSPLLAGPRSVMA